jgi:hypothetical protein
MPAWEDALIKEALAEAPPAALRQVIPLPSQVGEIVGQPWGGKTWVALQFAASVACGRDLLEVGLTATDTGPVTYVRMQDVSEVIRFRLWHIARELGTAADSLHLTEAPPLRIADVYGKGQLLDHAGNIDSDAMKALEAVCRGRRLVILDPLARICPDVESPALVSRTFAVLEQVAQKTGAAIIVCRNADKALDDKCPSKWRWTITRRSSPLPEVTAKRPVSIQASGAYRGTQADGAVLPEREYIRDEFGMLKKIDNETRILLNRR